jgi:acetyl-CoA acetyltransferase
MSLKGKAAIVGMGELRPMKTPPKRTGMGLIAEAASRAIQDAGLTKADIDGVMGEPPDGDVGDGYPEMLTQYLRIFPCACNTVGTLGASSAGMVWRAAAAIEAGLCTNVLCVQGTVITPRNVSEQNATRGNPEMSTKAEFFSPYGPNNNNTFYAFVAQRHAREFGTTTAQRARIAVDQRFNAGANPDALFYGKPITIEDVINSRLISDPLHLLECVMPCSGAAALVITSADRAKSLRHKPVYLLGAGECQSPYSIMENPDPTTSPIKIAAAKAFRMAGVGPRDINLVSVYDCYTITVLITLEDASFCKKGEGGPFVQQTDLTYKGKLPLNTHGGQLSFGQPGLAGGMSAITEAVRQLRGEAGVRQVANCELAYVNGNGGCLNDECSLILGRHVS